MTRVAPGLKIGTHVSNSAGVAIDALLAHVAREHVGQQSQGMFQNVHWRPCRWKVSVSCMRHMHSTYRRHVG